MVWSPDQTNAGGDRAGLESVPTLIGVALFMAMVFVLWAMTHLDRPEQRRDPDAAPADSSELEIA